MNFDDEETQTSPREEVMEEIVIGKAGMVSI